jgi:predicted Zn-dependent peptidase
MKHFMFLIIAAISLAASVSAQNPREMTFEPLTFTPPEPVRFETDNGLIIYFLEDHNIPVFTIQAYFHGGEVYDSEAKAGLAELTARLMRSGGAGERSPEEVDFDLDFVGASIHSNALSEQLTVSLTCLKKDIDTVFEIYADIILRPQFDSAKLALELSNKNDEILRQNDNPNAVTRRVYYETVFAGHGYGLNPTLASIKNLSRDDLIELHQMYYAPDNCIMAVSGDISLDDLKNLIEQYFGDWPQGNSAIEPPADAAMQYQPGVYYARREANQAFIRFGHLCMSDKNPDRFAMQVTNFAMGSGGFTSRMINQVRTSAGLAYSVGSYLFNRPYMGTFFGYCMTGAGTMGQALQMMMDIIEEVRADGITEEELKNAKESIINSYIFNYDTPAKIVNHKAYLEIMGFPPDQMQKSVEAYQAVTLDDCRRVAAEYLHPDKFAVIIVGDRNQFDQPLENFGPVTEVSLEIK